MNYYQTIPELNISGRMNTPEEFNKIGLPIDLTGWSVMDIGCNIGAFLIECHKRGATKLLGIDVDNDFLEEARKNFNKLNIEAEFRIKKQDKSDLVLLLSVLHVTENPQKLLDDAWSNTNKLLIVEINDRLQKQSIMLPKPNCYIGRNKDDRSVYLFTKDNG